MSKNNVEVGIKKLTLSVRTHISFEDIKNLLDCASRGSSYWSDSEKLGFESNAEKALTDMGILIRDDEEDNNVYRLDIKKIKRGLTVMAKKFPKHFAGFIEGDYDGDTGDVFLQCCLFGEVIYG